MKKVYVFITLFLLTASIASSQEVKLSCSEKKIKNESGKYPILVTTCFLKNFKFISTSYPDIFGIYIHSEHEVFVLQGKKYIATTNSKVFNSKQKELVDTINARILRDFKSFRSDSMTRDCLASIASIPTYAMDDLEISFYNDEIWFQVHWGLGSACRSVDGTIVTFKLDKIRKHL